MRAVGTLVGHHGVGRRPQGEFLGGSIELLAGLGQLPLEFEDRFIGRRVASVALECLGGAGQRFELVGQLPRRLLGAGQLHPRLCQLLRGAVADTPNLVDPPAELLAGEFELASLSRRRGGSLCLGLLRSRDAGLLRGAAEDHEDHQQRPHRAQQHGQERKQGDGGARLGAGSAHAAFPVRRTASMSPRRWSAARAASS